MDEARTTKESIPAISIRQPWAELILRGVKKIEIRDWTTPHRGDLYIHTGRMADMNQILKFGIPQVFRGGYVGMVQLVSIVPFTPERWDEWRDQHLAEGPYQDGMNAWILTKPRRFAHQVAGPGELGLFKPSADVAAELEKTGFA